MGALVRIEDPTDDRLGDYRALQDRQLRERREAQDAIFVVEGRVALRELLRSGCGLCSLLVDDHQARAIPDLVAAVRARQAPVYVATREVVAATVGFALHRGVVAVARRPAPRDARELIASCQPGGRSVNLPLLGVIEGVNDHENIGAIFRNAAGFGVRAVLLDPTCADPLYRRSVRVSAGHVLSVPFARLQPWPSGLGELRRAGVVLVALAPHSSTGPAARPPISPAQLSGRIAGASAVAVAVGAEGSGLSTGALRAADEIVSIPMAPGMDSLNVATAAAITFYELTRRTGGP